MDMGNGYKERVGSFEREVSRNALLLNCFDRTWLDFEHFSLL